ncbi:MAG TPA: hypothetical protein VIX35_08345, partial [Vicinamibacterales bacterium]
AWHSKLAAASILVFTVATGTVVTAQRTVSTPPPMGGAGGGGGGDTQPKAVSQTWTGTVSDAMCKGMHNGKDAKQCTADCVKNGSKYVLVVDEKTIYNIDNQKFKDLPKFAGDTAVVTGTIKDDTITITKMAAPKPK